MIAPIPEVAVAIPFITEITLFTPPTIFGPIVIIVPIADITFPTIIKTGPKAATSNATVKITCLTGVGNLFKKSTKLCKAETTLLIVGIISSAKAIANSSSCDLRIVNCPSKLSSIVSAIFSDVPSQLAIAVDNLSISLAPAFIKDKNPDIAFLPTNASALIAFSDSDKLENALLQSFKISFKDRMDPSALVVLIVTSPSLSPVSSMSPARLFMMVLNAVPAWELLIPELAINPIASAVSSALKPKAPAIEAQYLNVSPIMATFVFALDEAAAKISAKCPESAAVNPKAVKASVTISEVVAKSSPEAAARFMIPSIPSSMSCVFHPAIAM